MYLPVALAMVAVQPVGPQAMSEALIAGEARLSCEAKGDGGFSDCVVSSEKPEGQGFGAAALAAVQRVRVRAAKDGGSPRGRRVAVPMRFEFSPLEAAANGIKAPGVPERIEGGGALWRSTPSYSDLERYYPAAAVKAGRSGSARVVCLIAKDGSMRNCQVLGEAPEGDGFGEATRQLAERAFKIKVEDSTGRPTAGRAVVIPIIWRVGP